MLQKEKWLFGPGVGADADRRPITADMTDEQMGAANEHDTRWSKKNLHAHLTTPELQAWLRARWYDRVT